MNKFVKNLIKSANHLYMSRVEILETNMIRSLDNFSNYLNEKPNNILNIKAKKSSESNFDKKKKKEKIYLKENTKSTENLEGHSHHKDKKNLTPVVDIPSNEEEFDKNTLSAETINNEEMTELNQDNENNKESANSNENMTVQVPFMVILIKY